MSLLSRIRVDVALGLLTAGLLLYACKRDMGGLGGLSSLRERKRKRDDIETLEALGPILSDPAYLDVTERILLQCDPQTIMRVASSSKYLNDLVTSSLSLQLILRQYYHKIPPLIRPSDEQRKVLNLPKREQLDQLVDREERLSRFRHTKLQRCEMPYIDVLCSGDYMLVTRSLHSRFRIPDVPESGPIEDGFTVMVPEQGRTAGKDGLEGYRDWTVDVGEEIADIGVRSDEDMIVLATFFVPEEADPTKRVVQISFFHLEQMEPHPTEADRSVLVPHSQARHKTVEFLLDAEECRSIRLRAGSDGQLLIWAKHEEGCSHTRAIVYDWRQGVPIASPWINDGVQYGLPHDFTFLSPKVILAAVLTTTKPSSLDWTPTPGSDETPTRLEIQLLRAPTKAPTFTTGQRPKRYRSTDAGPIPQFSPDQFARYTHYASYRFPSFTHRWVNPGPSDDEVLPVEGGQTFRLVHSSIAAKPSPGSNGLGNDQGLLCITIEGDFGPITHPDGGPAHDHGCIAFCTIAGSVFSDSVLQKTHRPKIYEYDDWHGGNVSWDLGPGNTWVTGFGTRTTSVSRFLGFTNEGDELAVPDPDTAKRSTIVSVRLRNYDPSAVIRQGRVSRRPLGRPWSKDEGDSDNSGVFADRDNVTTLPSALVPEEILGLVNFTRRMQHGPHVPVIDDMADLFANMAATTGDTFRVVKKSEQRLPEMFSGVTLENTLPFYEANVAIHIDEERDEAAMDHPFKTILARDRLIVCDDGGFDVFHY